MRQAAVKKSVLIKRLQKLYGMNEPIFTEDIIKAWSEYSRPRVFQLIKELCEGRVLMKDVKGVYYFPVEAEWREGTLFLDTMKIIERRYLKYRGKVLGYYSGQTLMNMVGLSNQVPNTPEIVTMNETTRVRTVTVDGFNVILRRAKIKINEKNAPVMQLLEIFKDYNKPLVKYQRDNLIALAGDKIDEDILTECAKCFPKRALANLKSSGLYEVLAE
jgi:hypothetical protein